MTRNRSTYLPAMRNLMLLGMAFLYAPIIILIIYSFNSSRLVTVWSGLTTQWYFSLWHDEELVSALWVSLKVGTASATTAMLMGLLAGYVLSRFGSFRSRSLFSGLLSSPFIMPEVITGFSLLLLFVILGQVIGWPQQRGVATITLAHATLGMAYVAVLVQARFAGFDRSLEEAALDLGAKPLKVFFLITLPHILPALISGWLLAFTLSLDDLVIASFTSGPGATTLPMLIYSRVRLGVSPEINALATMILAAVTVTVISFVMIMAKTGNRRFLA